jgi:hypothetical protein
MIYNHYLIITFNNKFLIILFFFIDENEIYNNPNLHSEEQDELEIPDGN